MLCDLLLYYIIMNRLNNWISEMKENNIITISFNYDEI